MSKWYVWGRCVLKDGTITEWHSNPSHYKSKSAAHRGLAMRRDTCVELRIHDAEQKFPKWRAVGVASIQYMACPEGMTPRLDTKLIPKDLK
jgi:hypothetical protein